MEKRIPKYWSRQFKSFTGLEPTYEDYLKSPNMFKPSTLFEENPTKAIIELILLGMFILFSLLSTIPYF